MPYSTLEASAQDGAIVELYEFTYQAVTLRFVSGSHDLTFDSQSYTAVALERSEFEDTDQLSKNDLSIECPDDFAIAQLFAVAPPSDVVLLSIFRLHFGDTERVLAWSGRVLNAEWTGSARATLRCENLFTSLRRPGLRRRYTRGCVHELYGNACKAQNTSFETTATLTAVSGSSLSSTAFLALAAGYLSGGYLEWESAPGVFQRRAIRSHAGGSITVTHPIPGLPNGATVKVYAGCDHTLATCHSKFANAANYGGFPFIPQKNPFGSGSVF